MATHDTATWQLDNSFGPASTVGFDLTLLFEQVILRIVPSVLLFIVIPPRLFRLRRRSPRVLNKFLGRAKLIACFGVAAINLALLVLWALESPTQYAPIIASSLSVVATLLVLVTSQAEHVRSHRPSTLLCVYLTVSISSDAIICRTLWLLPDAYTLASVSSGMLVVEVTVFIMELQGKRNHLIGIWRNLGPEATAGIVSRGLFWWLNELMIRGFKATLSMSSLHHLDSELQASLALDKTLEFQLKNERKNRHKHRLLLLVIRCHKTALLLAVIPRLCLMGFTFAQPFLINRVITFVEGDKGNDPRSFAYGLMGATALVYLGLAFSHSLYKYRVFRAMTIIRACLVSMVLDRAVDLNDPPDDLGSSTLSLMSSDAEQIVQSFEDFHEIWANPIEISIAIWLLARILGVGALGPAIPFLVCTFVLMPPVAKRMGPAMKLWNAAIQKRVSVTSNIVGAMKEVKLLGVGKKWANIIQGLRKSELDQSKKFRWWIVVMNVIANTPPFLAPLLTFGLALAISSIHAHILTVANVFTSMSIIGLIVSPLASLLSAIPRFMSSLGSFERIQGFLNEIERQPIKHLDQGISEASGSRNIEMVSQNTSNIVAASDNTVITMTNASLGLTLDTATPLLNNVNISLRRSSITLIIGPVGSGKTTLLKGLLGVTPIGNPPEQSFREAAYCAQTPWLTNTNIRHNIVAYNEFDESWYREVLQASALDNDLEQLQSGDQTIVGSKGLSLSGGQQQRVSLARALYSKQTILLLDDVLSGLDVTTEAEVWARTFGQQGILRRQHATVVLVTNSLRYIDEVDSIILLKPHSCGTVVEQGTYGGMKGEEYLQKVLQVSRRGDGDPSSGQELAETKMDGVLGNRGHTQRDNHEEQDLIRQNGDITLYIYYLRSIGWSSGIIFIGTNVLATFGIIFPQIWLKIWAEANNSGQETNSGWYFGVLVMVSILGLLAEGFAIWFYFVITVPKSANNLHWTLLKAVMKAPLSFFVATDTGDIINRFSQDMSLIDKALPTALFMAVRMSLMAIAEGTLVFLGARYIAVIVPVVIIILYALGVFYLRTSRQMRFLDLQAKAPLYTHLLETIDGLTTIRAFGWQTSVRETGNKLLDVSLRPYYLLFLIQRWLNVVLDMFVAVVAFLLVTFAVLLAEPTASAYVALAMYNVVSFNSTLAQLVSSWTSLETSLGAISRLRTFEEKTPTERPPAQEVNVPNGWPGRGAISLHNISASHPTGDKELDLTSPSAFVLKDITFDIKPGEKIGICGRTGSGKSSLIATLSRLLELNKGRILVDGIDISNIDLATLRGNLISVPQQPVLFPETIRLHLGQTPSSDEALIDVLVKVGLWDMVRSHQGTAGDGLNAEVIGLPLSHGQKQLMCFARALLQRDRCKVLLLDEVTSALDRDTEQLIMRLIHTEFREHTVISVAHHLETLRGFDRVIVMERGGVAEAGEPEELLKKPGGKYRELWKVGEQGMG